MAYEKYKFLIETAKGDQVKLKLISALISLAEYPEASTLEKYEIAQYLDKAIRLAKDTVNELCVTEALSKKPTDPTLDEFRAYLQSILSNEGGEVITVSTTLDPHVFQAVVVEGGVLLRKEYTLKNRDPNKPLVQGEPNG